jgi:hypothetical protein
MDATTAVAIAGIVVAGFVGPSVSAWWAGRGQGRQHEHERTLHDLAELRSVLDDAAERIQRATVQLKRLGSEIASDLRRPAKGAAADYRAAKRETLVNETAEVIFDVGMASERIAIRVGSDTLVSRAYVSAHAKLRDSLDALARVNTSDDLERAGSTEGDVQSARRLFSGGD